MTEFITPNDLTDPPSPLTTVEVAELIGAGRDFRLPWRGSGSLWLRVRLTDAVWTRGARWDATVVPSEDAVGAGKAKVYLTSLRSLDADAPLPWEVSCPSCSRRYRWDEIIRCCLQ